jgi:putative transcriptional regulator
MSICHHPTDDLLLSYVAGTLGEGWSIGVATHLALCQECRVREAQFAAIGGSLLDEAPAAGLADGAMERCLARLDDPAESPTAAARDNEGTTSSIPAPLRDYVGGDLNQIRWKHIGGGIRQRIFLRRDTTRARLLYLPPGTAVPSHGHRGLELTMVLRGSYFDGPEQFHRGDIGLADEGVEHAQVAGMEGPCICLAITDAPLAFRTLLPRLAQRFIGI